MTAPTIVMHKWDDDECSCGSDTVLCQGCGRVVCGSVATWIEGVGNVEPACYGRFGRGHRGTVSS